MGGDGRLPMTRPRFSGIVPPVAGFWTHRFDIVLRPLRDRSGAQITIALEARTAAQATREATIRYPEMKVISVARAVEPVPVLTSRTVPTTPAATAPRTDAAEPATRARLA